MQVHMQLQYQQQVLLLLPRVRPLHLQPVSHPLSLGAAMLGRHGLHRKRQGSSRQARLGFVAIQEALNGNAFGISSSNSNCSSNHSSSDSSSNHSSNSHSSSDSCNSRYSGIRNKRGSSSSRACNNGCSSADRNRVATAAADLPKDNRCSLMQDQRQHQQQMELQQQKCMHLWSREQLLESLPFLSPPQICQAVFGLTRRSSGSNTPAATAAAADAAVLCKVAAHCAPHLELWPHRDVAMLGVSLALHYRQQQQQKRDGPVVEFLQRLGLHVLQHAAQYDSRDLLRLLPQLAALPPPAAAAAAKPQPAAFAAAEAAAAAASPPHLLAVLLQPLAAAAETLQGPSAVAVAFATAQAKPWTPPAWALVSLAQRIRCCWQQQQQQQTGQWPTLSDAARTAHVFCRFVAAGAPAAPALAPAALPPPPPASSRFCAAFATRKDSSTSSSSTEFWLEWLRWFLGAVPAIMVRDAPFSLSAAAAVSPLSPAAAAEAPFPVRRAGATSAAAGAVQRDLAALASALSRTSALLPEAHAPVWRLLLPRLLVPNSLRNSSSSNSTAVATEGTSQKLKGLALGCAAAARCSITAAEKRQLLQQAVPLLVQHLQYRLPVAQAATAAATKTAIAANSGALLPPVTAKVLLSSFAAVLASSDATAVQQLLLLLCTYTRVHAKEYSSELLAYAAADMGLLSTVSSSSLLRSEATAAVVVACELLLQRLQQQQKQLLPLIPREAAAALLAVLSRMPALPVRLVEVLQQQLLNTEGQQQQQQQAQHQKQPQSSSRVSQLVACFLALSRVPRSRLSLQWLEAEHQLLQLLQQKHQQQQHGMELSLGEVARLFSSYAVALREPPQQLLRLLHQLLLQLQQEQLHEEQPGIEKGLSVCMQLARLLEAAVSLSLHLPGKRQQNQVELPQQLHANYVELLGNCLGRRLALHRRQISHFSTQRLCLVRGHCKDQLQQQKQQQQQQAQQLLQQQRGLVGIAALCATHLHCPSLLADALQLRMHLTAAAAAPSAPPPPAPPPAAAVHSCLLAPSEKVQVARFVACVVGGCYIPLLVQQQQQQGKRQTEQHGKQQQRQQAWEQIVLLLGGWQGTATAAARAALGSLEASNEAMQQEQQQRKQQQQMWWTSEKQHGSRPSLRMQIEVANAIGGRDVLHEVQSCLYTLDLLLHPLPLLHLG